MRNRGHEITVLAQYRSDVSGSLVYGDGAPSSLPGVEVIGVPQTNEAINGNFEADIAELSDIAIALHDNRRFDIIHGQYAYPPGAAAITIGRKAGLPAIVSFQGGDGHWFGTCCEYHLAVLRWILESASAVIFPTVRFSTSVSTRASAAPRGRVIPGAVDTTLFTFDAKARATWRRQLGIDYEAVVIAYHGRLDRRKGLVELIRAFENLSRSDGPVVHLIVAGRGPDAAHLLELARRVLDPDRFSWLDRIAHDEVPGLLSSADLYCSPTYREGFSNTLLEAGALGLPLLTTDTLGVADVFRHMDNAWLVPIEDAAILSDALRTLVRSKALRVRLGESVRDFVTQKFSWDLVASAVETLYTEAAVIETLPLPEYDRVEFCRFRAQPLLL